MRSRLPSYTRKNWFNFMQRSLRYFVLFLLLLTGLFLYPKQLFAGGGGRAVITVLSNGVAKSKSAEVVATIYKDNDVKLSPGEKGIFRVKNARDGQTCITKNEVADGDAKIYGSCSSSVAGEMEVYIHFPDKVEDASPYKVSFAEAGGTASSPTSSAPSGATAPCKSGLVSYGWDPKNGKNCQPYYFDSWTAYCGNGYQQDVPLNQCVYANDLSDTWKAEAERICNDPRCNVRPAVSTPPTTVAASTRPTTIPSPRVAEANAIPPVAQYLLVEQRKESGGVDLDLYMRKQVVAGDGRVYFVVVAAPYSGTSNPLRSDLLEPGSDPWVSLTSTYGLTFTPATGVVDLDVPPQVFTKDRKDELLMLLQSKGVLVSTSLRRSIDRMLPNAEQQLIVFVTAENPPTGGWLPTLHIRGIGWGIQEFIFPVVTNERRLDSDSVFDFELGVLSIDPYKAKNALFNQSTFDFNGNSLQLGSQSVIARYVSQVSWKKLNIARNNSVQILRDYPDNVQVQKLPKSPPAPDESMQARPSFRSFLNHQLERATEFFQFVAGIPTSLRKIILKR